LRGIGNSNIEDQVKLISTAGNGAEQHFDEKPPRRIVDRPGKEQNRSLVEKEIVVQPKEFHAFEEPT
jgi:hypothetical protein